MKYKTSNTIDSLSKEIELGNFSIFCGAGISYNSGLPIVNVLNQYILEKLGATNEEISKILSSNLPFEKFIKTLFECGFKKDLLLDIFEEGEPNSNHILVAKLAAKGYIKNICTTNFDLLIEKALNQEGLIYNQDYQVFRKEDEFEKIDWQSDKINIIKIHGSIDDRESIIVTLDRVAARKLSDQRAKIINYLFDKGNHQKVFIMGYSCSDIFDISPAISRIEDSKKQIIILEHSNDQHIEDIKVKKENNPFSKFQESKRLYSNTDDLVKNLWNTLINNAPYNYKNSKTEWKIKVDNWIGQNIQVKNYLLYNIFLDISDFHTAFKYASIEAIKNKAKVWMDMGHILHNLGRYNDAKESYDKALSCSSYEEDEIIKIKTHRNIGVLYQDTGHYGQALESFIKSDIDNDIFDEYTKVKTLSNVEVCQYFNGNGNVCKIDDVINMAEDRGFLDIKISLLGVKALIDCDQGDIKIGIKRVKKAIQLAYEINDTKQEAHQYTRLANIYSKYKNNSKKALKYYEKALQLTKLTGNKIEEAQCKRNIGFMYLNLLHNIKTKAFNKLKSSLEIIKLNNIPVSKEQKSSIMETLVKIGIEFSFDFDYYQAIDCWKESLNLAEELSDNNRITDVLGHMGMAYGKLNQFPEAVSCFQRALNVDPKNNTKRTANILTSLQHAKKLQAGK